MNGSHSDLHFPKGFLWGVATSAYQIEGAESEDGRGPSIWDTFCRIPGAISDGSSGSIACDHYNRLEADLDLMVELGLPAYRFSIAWPRLQPRGRGVINPKGLDFYQRLVDGLLKRNITPFLTLFHWDLPQALQDLGGWANRDIAYWFADYAEIVAKHLGDRVKHITTHNEPWIVATFGYDRGNFAPGINNRKQSIQASHHLLLSHGLAVNAMHATDNTIQCGIVLNQAPIYPWTDSPEDLAQVKLEDGKFVRWYMDPLFRGEYPADVLPHLGNDLPEIQPDDFKVITTPIQYLGINYYTRNFTGHGKPPPRSGALEFTDMGWEIYPDGFVELVTRLNREYKLPPIYITENGAAFPDKVENGKVHDTKRTEFLKMHVAAVSKAIAAGVDIRGYFIWSLIDNFEWTSGYSKRFGIVYADYQTQKRIPKDSAWWYRDFISYQNSR